MGDEVYETYIRTKDGETKDVSFREGLEQFLSENGYRISINIEGIVITLRRDTVVDESIKRLDKSLNERRLDCMVTFKGSRLDSTLHSLFNQDDYDPFKEGE